MADFLTQEQRSKKMWRVRGRDTKPEMVVRRKLINWDTASGYIDVTSQGRPTWKV